MQHRFILLFLFLTGQLFAQGNPKFILDADTGNEVDDLYAIVRVLIEPGWDLLGVNATQWQITHWREVPNSMENSHRLNQVLMAYVQEKDRVPTYRGATARLFDWGNKSQTSPASNFIVEEARKMPEGEKLNVVALGALTNVASALLDAPDIAPKVRLYWLGSSYDFGEGTMKNTDFNSVMDIQAVDIILHTPVETHIIPNNVAVAFDMTYAETKERLAGKHEVFDYLLYRWFQHLGGGRLSRILWDVALVEAIIHPEWAEKVKITTSKERGSREVHYYRSIQDDRMREDFFRTLLAYFANE
ncbi:nucleoside hydrolase [Lewinella sp. W8]|uniref:nucleoside hydrolase n=1 Tax=Lewinella sp. W8 TaxID=2528208 RepID=UPI0010679504|nr:nucleoside hydrolase [Lewinella sp. W8]MTB50258.1 nucleoside hydrolase [Lewinella sp. W8]